MQVCRETGVSEHSIFVPSSRKRDRRLAPRRQRAEQSGAAPPRSAARSTTEQTRVCAAAQTDLETVTLSEESQAQEMAYSVKLLMRHPWNNQTKETESRLVVAGG